MLTPDDGRAPIETNRLKFLQPLVEGEGSLPDCAVLYPDGPCWELEFDAPTKFIGIPGIASGEFRAQPGMRETFNAESGRAVASLLATTTGNAVKLGAERSVQIASQGAGIFTDWVSKGIGNVQAQFDLDGVQLWGGQKPLFYKGNGMVEVEHSAEGGYFAELRAQTDDETAKKYVWLDEEPVDPEEPEGPTKEVLKGGGATDLLDPYARFEEGSERVTVPRCIWEGTECT